MERIRYSDLLKDPKWQKKRLKIFERDNFTCQLCNSKENTLHIHHKKYIQGKNPWEYEDKDLLTVCETCHLLIEEFKNNKINIFDYKVRRTENEGGVVYFIANLTTLYIGRIQRNNFELISHLPIQYLLKLINEVI